MPKEEWIRIRSMYGHVTQHARLILLGLVVKGWRSRRDRLRQNLGMAFQTKLVRLRAVQKMRVSRSMRAMTGDATFLLQRRMFKNEWPRGIDVAFGTHPALGCVCEQIVRNVGAVRIMAIGTRH
jgi:hypothetical protein